MKIRFDVDQMTIGELRWLQVEHGIDLEDFGSPPTIDVLWGLVCLDARRKGMPVPDANEVRLGDIDLELPPPLDIEERMQRRQKVQTMFIFAKELNIPPSEFKQLTLYEQAAMVHFLKEDFKQRQKVRKVGKGG